MVEISSPFTVTESDENFVKFSWTIDTSSIQYSGNLQDIERTERTSNSVLINSGKFSIHPYDSIEWEISVIIKCNFGHVRISQEKYFYEIDFTVVLKGEKFDDKNLEAMFCYNIIDKDCVVYTKNPVLNYTFSNSDSETDQSHLLSPALSNNRLVFFGNNSLIIEGHITVEKNCCRVIQNAEFGNLRQLQNDWTTALKDILLADVSLEVDGSILKVHNLVLSSRSPVFRKMFETDMIENSENTVKIEDVTKPIMEAFILFLYTGAIEDQTFDTVAGLYYAADKYDVKSLLDTCRDLLVSYLSLETVLQIIKLSYRHSDSILQGVATNFIVGNFQKIFPTNEWKSFLDTNPLFASYIIMEISLKNLSL